MKRIAVRTIAGTRKRARVAACVIGFLPAAVSAAASAAPVDLSLRTVIYATGKTTAIDDARNARVMANGTMTLYPSEATSCTDRGCTFNLGFTGERIIRGAPFAAYASPLMTYTTATSGGTSTGGALNFEPDDIDEEGCLAVALAYGTNEVTITIDPYNKMKETDESNNSVTFTVIVRHHAPGRSGEPGDR